MWLGVSVDCVDSGSVSLTGDRPRFFIWRDRLPYVGVDVVYVATDEIVIR